MPIVDISGLAPDEARSKTRVRQNVQRCFRKHLEVPLDSTAVTFITDETAGSGPAVPVIARLYSKMFAEMEQVRLNALCDEVALILEKEAGHDFNEAFPASVMAMRGGTKPYKPE